jgi:hypothetical protein
MVRPCEAGPSLRSGRQRIEVLVRLEDIAQRDVVCLGDLAALHLKVKDRADRLLEEWVVRIV